MAWYNSLKDLTGDVKKGVTTVGHTVGSVASNPFVDGVAGAFLGPEAGALLGGVGSLIAPGGNLGTAVKGGLTGAAAGEAGSLLKGGAGALARSVFGGGGSAAGTVAGDTGATGTTSASSPSLVDRIEGILKQGGSALGIGGAAGAGTSGGGNSLIDDLLLGGSVASQAADKSHMSDLQNQAIQSATGAYNEKAPLRARALASLSTDQAAPDLSSIFVDPGNPYARQRAGLPPLTATPSAASQMTSGNALSGALAARVPASTPMSVGAAS